MLLCHLAWMFPAGVLLLGAGTASAQNYPDKPIRIITSGVGGGNDRMANELAKALAGPLGQAISVVNLQGGLQPGAEVAKAQPDGHTFLVYNNTLWIGPLLQDAPYDAQKDFAPIAELARTPNVLVVSTDSPVKTVAELIALAKTKPGELRYGTSGAGAGNHLAGELFASMAGIKLKPVVYKGSGAAVKDLIAGEMQLMFPTAVSATPQVKAGRFRALGVTSAAPSALMPGVPPIATMGLPGYEAITIFCSFAPGATPPAVVKRLNAEMMKFLGQPDVKERLFGEGMEVSGGAPAQLTATMKSELARMTRVIKDANIRVNE